MSEAVTPRVAYFCMEYGLCAELTIYSGGLGVLAGDLMKSVGDQNAPVTGIGLLWDRGYTRQRVDEHERIVDEYPPTPRAALEPIAVEFSVDVAGQRVPLRACRVADYTTAELLLIEPTQPEHMWITRSLYGGGEEARIAQEILLGIGGVRLLRALGRDVDVYHFNEGHAVFAGHELLREERARGGNFAAALARVRERVVFTTHTPVAAGNETHRIRLLERMGAALDLSPQELEALGGAPYSMTAAGLRMARRVNGVAELHGETARGMWAHVEGGNDIIAITNGVHRGTWQDAGIREAVAAGDDQQLWAAHQTAKQALCDEIAARTGARLAADTLLIGFARRAATYKRADLILGDPERLDAWFRDGRVQLVFAGKAHPRDTAGKKVLARIVTAARRWREHIVFMQDYDMTLGALLTRGCDVWLNTPRRPMEASGTSGMKAAMNGVLNCSILDGWWPEACEHGVNGWHIDAPDAGDHARDARDRSVLLSLVEEEIAPRYYQDRAAWLAMMRASIASTEERFSSDRMLRDYYEQLYSASA